MNRRVFDFSILISSFFKVPKLFGSGYKVHPIECTYSRDSNCGPASDMPYCYNISPVDAIKEE